MAKINYKRVRRLYHKKYLHLHRLVPCSQYMTMRWSTRCRGYVRLGMTVLPRVKHMGNTSTLVEHLDCQYTFRRAMLNTLSVLEHLAALNYSIGMVDTYNTIGPHLSKPEYTRTKKASQNKTLQAGVRGTC